MSTNPLLQSIHRTAMHTPERIALVGTQEQYSYAELCSQVDLLAQKLKDAHCRVVALLGDNHPDWVIVDLACQQANLCFLPLPTYFSPTQLLHSLTEAAVDTVLLGTGVLLPAPLLQQLVPEDFSLCYQIIKLPVSKRDVLPEGTVKITFTSGSTGQPKGVCLSLDNQIRVAKSLAEVVNIDAPKHLCVLPLPTLLENIAGVYAPLLAGGQVHIPSLGELGFSGSSSFDVRKLLGKISAVEPNSMILTPQLLEALTISVAQGWIAPSSLQFIAVGGSRVSASMIARARWLGLPVYEGYGLSECASVVSLNRPKADLPGSAGKLLPHMQLKIHAGEIILSGNSFLGYVNEPESWYADSVATGDLGFMDTDEFLHLQGRKKNLLISSYGRNISPEWVESEIKIFPQIRQVVVFGDARPFCVALLYSDPTQIADAELQICLDKMNQSLPDYARILHWARVPEPFSVQSNTLTANGRPKREAIAQQYALDIERLYQGCHSGESRNPLV